MRQIRLPDAAGQIAHKWGRQRLPRIASLLSMMPSFFSMLISMVLLQRDAALLQHFIDGAQLCSEQCDALAQCISRHSASPSERLPPHE
jgi:hypothetical protein